MHWHMGHYLHCFILINIASIISSLPLQANPEEEVSQQRDENSSQQTMERVKLSLSFDKVYFKPIHQILHLIGNMDGLSRVLKRNQM